MMSQLTKIKEALVSIEGLDVYHYWRPRLNAPYVIWAEDGEGSSLHTNNHKSEQVITGTIDYFTKTDLDVMVDTIQDKLNTVEDLAWSSDAVDYEEDTNLIHFTWIFEII